MNGDISEGLRARKIKIIMHFVGDFKEIMKIFSGKNKGQTPLSVERTARSA